MAVTEELPLRRFISHERLLKKVGVKKSFPFFSPPWPSHENILPELETVLPSADFVDAGRSDGRDDTRDLDERNITLSITRHPNPNSSRGFAQLFRASRQSGCGSAPMEARAPFLREDGFRRVSLRGDRQKEGLPVPNAEQVTVSSLMAASSPVLSRDPGLRPMAFQGDGRKYSVGHCKDRM